MKLESFWKGKSMLKQQAMADSQKHLRLSWWKRLILIVSMLLPGGSLAVLVPNQPAYADASWSPIFICRAGDGGDGGVATNGSGGGNGAPGGDCVFGPKGGDGAPGGQNASPGGPGGNVIL